MEKYNKIHWKKGLPITPEFFIASDNYHIAERNLLGRFVASRLYGILPGRKFDIKDNILYIDKLEAITRDGYVINIQSNTSFSLKETTDTECYVIIAVDPHYIPDPDDADDDKKLSYVYPKYNLVLKRIGEPVEKGIPVLKIRKDGEIDKDYIPPSIALDSVVRLKEQYREIKCKLDLIIEKLPENNAVYVQAMLLKFELDNYTLQESPQELSLLLKKICRTLQLYLKSEKKINELLFVKRFMEERYDHDDIGNILQLGFESLEEINQEMDQVKQLPQPPSPPPIYLPEI